MSFIQNCPTCQNKCEMIQQCIPCAKETGRVTFCPLCHHLYGMEVDIVDDVTDEDGRLCSYLDKTSDSRITYAYKYNEVYFKKIFSRNNFNLTIIFGIKNGKFALKIKSTVEYPNMNVLENIWQLVWSLPSFLMI